MPGFDPVREPDLGRALRCQEAVEEGGVIGMRDDLFQLRQVGDPAVAGGSVSSFGQVRIGEQ